ncbi:helix-turn-helix domain-containing protein [Antribacter gilvus]|uniref:helix-turn-helix domain-containing protein n=1 Tax=Antribacter gilvus TaxID=2304675 RepID=UPI000F773E6D|nr:helix-turn-helix transcriptional regulator [Antribacter gilvus]
MTDKPPRQTSDLGVRMGKALRELLSDHGITLDQVADVLGPARSRAYVSERTNGTRELSTDIIYAAAKLLHLTDDGVMVEIFTRMRRPGS